MKKLTILLPTLSMGGAEHMVYELVKKLDTSRFAPLIVCYQRRVDSELARQVEADFPVTYLNQSGKINLMTALHILRSIRRTKPDVVHAHLGGAGFGAIWCALFHKPLVITVHTRPEKAFTKKIEALVRIALHSSNAGIVAVSAENQMLLQEYFHPAPEKCLCVNNGIDLNLFHHKIHESFTLINVARHDDNKNQAMLLRCFAKFHGTAPETKLLLLGDGPNHEKLKDLAKELGVADAVTFTGNVANTEDYYAVSDLYVQCSFREAMPLSVLEAMASGLPIVSTNVGGLSDVVQDNGILVVPGDDEALFQAISQCYHANEEEKSTMSKASLRIVQDYSAEKMAEKYEEIYSDLCGK